MRAITTQAKTQLLAKYLIREYGETDAKNIMLDNHNNLFGYHGLAWSLGKRNLEFFCMYFLSDIYSGDGKAELSQSHFDTWKELQDIILNKNVNKMCYIKPRGWGKSTIVTLAVSVWCALYGFKTYIVIASAIGATAEGFISNIKLAVSDNKEIFESFGKIFDKRKCICNSEKIEFTNHTLIESIPATSSFRGRSYNNKRIELALLDDFQKADEIVSDEQKERKWKRFSDDVNYAMQKDNSTIIALGTLQCKSDFYDRLRNSPVWKVKQEKGILLDDVQTLFNSGKWAEFKRILTDSNNEYALDDAKEYYLQNKDSMQFPLLWQEYWNCLDIALQYYSNPVSFMQEFQGNIDNIGVKVFETVITKSADYINNLSFTKSVLTIDPAGTDRNSSKRDYYAFCILSETDNNIRYAQKSLIKDFEFNDYMKLTIQLLKEYADVNTVIIEKNTYSGADVVKLKELIAADHELSGRHINIINKYQNQNKDNRINTIAADVNMGRVIFNADDTEAIQQLRDFAGCKYSLHDDYPDCLAMAIETISTIENIPKLKAYNFDVLGL